MKTLILPFILLGMFLLGSCTETIIDEVIKLDTVYVDRPVNTLVPTYITVVDTIVIRDTVEVRVVVHDTIVNEIHTTDTVYQVVTKDSVIIRQIEKIIYHTDTVVQVVHDTVINNIHHYDTIVKNVIVHDTVEVMVYDRTVIYLDTFYAVSYLRPVFSMPDDIIPHLEEFNQLCYDRGLQPDLGSIIVQYVAELPGEGWSSNSFQVAENSQIVIQLDQRYPAALHRAGMFRELARIGLNKKYTVVPDRIMNNLFPPDRQITQSHLNDLFK